VGYGWLQAEEEAERAILTRAVADAEQAQLAAEREVGLARSGKSKGGRAKPAAPQRGASLVPPSAAAGNGSTVTTAAKAKPPPPVRTAASLRPKAKPPPPARGVSLYGASVMGVAKNAAPASKSVLSPTAPLPSPVVAPTSVAAEAALPVAAKSLAPPASSGGWSEHATLEGKLYYSNGVQTRWDRPAELGTALPPPPPQQQQRQLFQRPRERPQSMALPASGRTAVQPSRRPMSIAVPQVHDPSAIGSDGEEMEFV
jgi:hypothetical protein